MDARPSPARERIDLDLFLANLPGAEAGQLRAEAARIDELERYAMPVRGIEQTLRWPFIIAVVMFLAGLALFIVDNRHLEISRVWIGDIGLCVLLGALPVLTIYYAFKVRWRTRADKLAFDINKRHFLPHGALYFPASGTTEKPAVVIVDETLAYRPKPTKNDKLRPGAIW